MHPVLWAAQEKAAAGNGWEAVDRTWLGAVPRKKPHLV